MAAPRGLWNPRLVSYSVPLYLNFESVPQNQEQVIKILNENNVALTYAVLVADATDRVVLMKKSFGILKPGQSDDIQVCLKPGSPVLRPFAHVTVYMDVFYGGEDLEQYWKSRAPGGQLHRLGESNVYRKMFRLEEGANRPTYEQLEEDTEALKKKLTAADGTNEKLKEELADVRKQLKIQRVKASATSSSVSPKTDAFFGGWTNIILFVVAILAVAFLLLAMMYRNGWNECEGSKFCTK